MDSAYIAQYLKETIQIAQSVDRDAIAKCAKLLRETREKSGRLFILGVGGSAANASHAVNDFRKIGGIEAYTPTDNVAEITARTNDEGWETTFVEYLRTSKLSDRDAIMVLSVGGGNMATSRNIVRALQYGQEKHCKILSIVSRDGGYAKTCADACILVPVVAEDRITPHAEGWQGVLWHLLVNAIRT